MLGDEIKNKGKNVFVPLTNVRLASFLPLQVHSGGFYGGSSSIDPNHLISSLIAVSFGWSSMVEIGENKVFGVRPRLGYLFHLLLVG